MTGDIGGRWTARQLAMLQAMGIDFGMRPRDAGTEPAAATAGGATSATSARSDTTAASRARGITGGAPAATARVAAPPPASTSSAPHPSRPSDPTDTAPAPAPDRIARYMDDLATATAAAPARGESAVEPSVPAHWLVVSEPLPAGSPPARLLAAMLRAAGLMPMSATGPVTPLARRAALALFEPGADLAADRARLMDAVLRAAPRCIVVFGRAPARALLSTELPLAELRGKVHRLGETPVVVSFAVPYLLRQPADKAKAWDDLCLATRACEATA